MRSLAKRIDEVVDHDFQAARLKEERGRRAASSRRSVRGDSRKAEGGRFITPSTHPQSGEGTDKRGSRRVTRHKVFPACGRLCVRAHGDGSGTASGVPPCTGWNPEDGPPPETDEQHGGLGGHLPAGSKNVKLISKFEADGSGKRHRRRRYFNGFAYLNASSPECAANGGAGTGVPSSISATARTRRRSRSCPPTRTATRAKVPCRPGRHAVLQGRHAHPQQRNV